MFVDTYFDTLIQTPSLKELMAVLKYCSKSRFGSSLVHILFSLVANWFPDAHTSVMLILVLVLKDSLRTKFQSLSLQV